MSFTFGFYNLYKDAVFHFWTIFSESSFNDIFRLAILTSRFTIIGIAYIVNSFSDWISIPLWNYCLILLLLVQDQQRLTPIALPYYWKQESAG